GCRRGQISRQPRFVVLTGQFALRLAPFQVSSPAVLFLVLKINCPQLLAPRRFPRARSGDREAYHQGAFRLSPSGLCLLPRWKTPSLACQTFVFNQNRQSINPTASVQPLSSG